ncbi:MAG: MgtC/SapB family protein [Candidatus Omnitrophota bacterium]
MSTGFLVIVWRILLTVILCGLIGAERGVRHKEAGLRTHVLVGVGSALIVLTSFHVFDIYKNVTTVDPTRIISGIVTGVGFLCAGTIIQGGRGVRGLTTAATLWIVAGIGMAVGSGDYTAAFVVAIAVFIILIGLRSFEKRLDEKFNE